MASLSKSDPIIIGESAASDSNHIGMIVTPEPEIKKWVLWKRVSLAAGYCVIVWGLIIFGLFQLFG